MHPSRSGRLSLLLTFLAIAACAEATPYLPADIAPGARFTGFFTYPTTGSPPDGDPDSIRGFYPVNGPPARMVVTVGATEFSSSPGPMIVQTLDQPVDADWIQLFGKGSETTFAPYLSNFARQNPALEPFGAFVLNFRFPRTHLPSDAFPTSIDPLATTPYPSHVPPTGIFGQVEGISVQRPGMGIQEWAFFFHVDPLEINIVASAGMLTGRFVGTISGVEDHVVVGPPSAVPEPASFILFMTGLIGLMQLAKRPRHARPL